MQQPFNLAELLVNPLELTISNPAGIQLSIQQKPMEVLLFLVAQYPAMVTRQQLIDSVWAGNAYVGEKALTNAIWQLRNAFQQLTDIEIISTIRKKGYRLALAPSVSPAPSDPTSLLQMLAENSLSETDTKQEKQSVTTFLSGQIRWWIFAGLFLTSLAVMYRWQLPQSKEIVITTYTKGIGRAVFPAVSPNERYVAFSWRKFEAVSDLYVIDLYDTEAPPRQLTFGPDEKSRPLWGHDNRHLYYSSQTAVYGECLIMQLDVITLETSALASCNRHGTLYMDLSPDGRYLVFSGSLQEDGSSLYRLDLQNSEAEPEPLPCLQNCQYRIRDLVFSPDGRYMALTRRAHRLSEEIYIQDLETGKEFRLTHGEEDILGFTWHPDGERLVYSALKHGKRQGFITHIKKQETQLLAEDNFSWPSHVNTAGEVFYHNSRSVPQLAYLPLEQQVIGAIFPLTAAEARYEAPDYSEALQALVYVSNESGYMEIWRADPQMEKRTQLTRLFGMVKYPQWSNDGRFIAFVGRLPAEETDKLMLLELKTGRLTQLQTGVRWHGQISWWYDDSAVIFSHSGNLFSINIQTEQVQQLTTRGGVWAQMPDANSLYFSKGRNRGLWQLLPDGQEIQLLAGSVFSSRTAWTVADSKIYFLQKKPEQLLVSYYDTAQQETKDLILLPPDQLHLQSVMSFDTVNQRLLFELSMLPRADIHKMRHPQLQ